MADSGASAHPGQLTRRRYECKYLVTVAQVPALRRYLAPHVEIDPHGLGRPGQRYGVSSLYLDDGGRRLYWETLDGIPTRYKLRVRSYSDEMQDPVFLEVKHRRHGVVLKERCRIRRPELQAVLAGKMVATSHMSRAELGALESFREKVGRIGARPVVMVRYQRHAFCGIHDPELRVTFDHGIQAFATKEPRFFFTPGGWNLVEGRRVVLELKFNDRCPAVLASMIQHFGLLRISYSKYAHAVHAATLDLGLDHRARGESMSTSV